jgi:Post-transcriptional regulator
LEIVQTVSEWKGMVLPVLKSKAEEFHFMGYKEATTEDVWKCLMEKVWKGDPEKRIYEVVGDIFQLNTATYISYLTMDAYKNDDLLASIQAVTNMNNG